MTRVGVILFFFISFSTLSAFAERALHYDSIGLTTRSQGTFIVHRVEPGETLYAISRRYAVDIASIKSINSSIASTGLKAGDQILIPVSGSDAKRQTTGRSKHQVKPGETLFSISQQYSVSLSDLRQWNNLMDNALSVGQQLIVSAPSGRPAAARANESTVPPNAATHEVKPGETLFSISRAYGLSTRDLKEWNNLTDNNVRIGQQLLIAKNEVRIQPAETKSQGNSSMLPADEKAAANNPAAPAAEKPAVVIDAAPDTDSDTRYTEERSMEKVLERGIAEVIEEAGDTKKYLALHRKAPVGTIMQIKNDMNGQSVFVRVVGKIPEAGDNEKVLVKISKKAYDRLGAVDLRFPVEVSYIP
jgi:LysM repeat protein